MMQNFILWQKRQKNVLLQKEKKCGNAKNKHIYKQLETIKLYKKLRNFHVLVITINIVQL